MTGVDILMVSGIWWWFDAMLFCCRIKTECWVEMSLLKAPSVIRGSFSLSIWALQTLGPPSPPRLHPWLCIDDVPRLFINWRLRVCACIYYLLLFMIYWQSDENGICCVALINCFLVLFIRTCVKYSKSLLASSMHWCQGCLCVVMMQLHVLEWCAGFRRPGRYPKKTQRFFFE